VPLDVPQRLSQHDFMRLLLLAGAICVIPFAADAASIVPDQVELAQAWQPASPSPGTTPRHITASQPINSPDDDAALLEALVDVDLGLGNQRATQPLPNYPDATFRDYSRIDPAPTQPNAAWMRAGPGTDVRPVFTGTILADVAEPATDLPGWGAYARGGMARLTYGIPDTDSVDLLIDCRIEDGMGVLLVTNVLGVRPTDVAKVELRGPVHSIVLAGLVEIDLNDSLSVHAPLLAVRDAVAPLRGRGLLRVIGPGTSREFQLNGESEQRIREFEQACPLARH
jgi:hypothetical protein